MDLDSLRLMAEAAWAEGVAERREAERKKRVAYATAYCGSDAVIAALAREAAGYPDALKHNALYEQLKEKDMRHAKMETKTVWHAADGAVEVRHMDTDHIENTISYLHRRKAHFEDVVGSYKQGKWLEHRIAEIDEWIAVFFDELKRRRKAGED